MVQPVALTVPLKRERKPSPLETLPVNVQPLPVPVTAPVASTVSESGAVVRDSRPLFSLFQLASPVHVAAMLSKLVLVVERLAFVPVEAFGCEHITAPSAIQERSTISDWRSESSRNRWFEPSPVWNPLL